MLNQNKLLTINSQPAVNGLSSSDAKFGWGPENGYVYQKAYFEFFIHKDLLKPLVAVLEEHKEMTYQAVNAQGENIKNVADGEVNAVTWGVFRGKEVVQPTVVDHEAFLIWKDEAFKVWLDNWALIYQKHTVGEKELAAEEDSIKFLAECHDSLYLMNIVDNDFIESKLGSIMKKFVEDNSDLISKL